MIVLRLRLPPSANNLFANVPGKGRVKTQRYRAWITAAGWELKIQRPAPIAGPVSISIGLKRSSALADLDGKIKALLDLLVRHSLIEDDRMVEEIHIRWDATDATATLRVATWAPDKSA